MRTTYSRAETFKKMFTYIEPRDLEENGITVGGDTVKGVMIWVHMASWGFIENFSCSSYFLQVQ